MELVLASHCLVDVPFAHRAEAAAEAGFDGIGLSVADYDRARAEGLSDDDIDAVLASTGLVLAELECVRGVDAAGPEQLDRLLAVGERFAADRLQAIGTFGGQRPGAGAVESFAQVCDRAASVGMTVALEFLPPTSIPDLAAAARIVKAAGRDNGGICLDAWHFFRGTPDLHAVARLPAGSVAMVQLDDGLSVPTEDDYLRDTLDNRLLPGQGEFDLDGLLSALEAGGNLPVVSAEVISKAVQRLPAGEAAARIAEATRAALAALPHPAPKEAS